MRIESVRDLHGQFPDIDGYWASGDYAATEAAIRSAFPADVSGEWSVTALDAITQLVRAQNLQGKSVEAKETLELARKLIMAIDPAKRTRLEIRLLLEEGRHICLSMMPSKAQTHFNLAFKPLSNFDWRRATKISKFDCRLTPGLWLPLPTKCFWPSKPQSCSPSASPRNSKTIGFNVQ